MASLDSPVVVVANPAAAAEFWQTVPAGSRWQLRAVSVALVQGATQTPQPILQVRDAGVNEIESIVATGGTAGDFTLTFSGQTTGNINFDDTAAEVQAALEALSNVAPGDVLCAGGPLPEVPVTVEFKGFWAQTDVTQMTVTDNITGGTAAVTTVRGGVAGNVIYESFGASNVQAVSTTCRYNWAPGLTLSAVTGATTNVHATASLPAGLILPENYQVRSNTIGIGANSDYGAATLLVSEV